MKWDELILAQSGISPDGVMNSSSNERTHLMILPVVTG